MPIRCCGRAGYRLFRNVCPRKNCWTKHNFLLWTKVGLVALIDISERQGADAK